MRYIDTYALEECFMKKKEISNMLEVGHRIQCLLGRGGKITLNRAMKDEAPIEMQFAWMTDEGKTHVDYVEGANVDEATKKAMSVWENSWI